ncbi:hypothetical protein Leryth_023930 [Lithospermum erythrorhizon]|nr:hypothetical protein Leryth_023930 [Lithospermum erythrorhizon]
MVSSCSPFSCTMPFFIFFSIFLLFSNLIYFSSCQHIHEKYGNLTTELQNFTAMSPFRLINRRVLAQCANDQNPYLDIKIQSRPQLYDEEYVKVIVSGVLHPSADHWVAMISPSHSQVSSCPLNAILYQMTGDLSLLPLLCHYPVKAQFLSKDPNYLECKKKECKKQNNGGVCALTTCNATLTFHVINIRSEIEFVLFGGSFEAPCILKRSLPISFVNPKKPLYGHLASIDSTGSSVSIIVYILFLLT